MILKENIFADIKKKVNFKICPFLVLWEKFEMGTDLKARRVAWLKSVWKMVWRYVEKDLLVSTAVWELYKYAASSWVSQSKIPTPNRSKVFQYQKCHTDIATAIHL